MIYNPLVDFYLNLERFIGRSTNKKVSDEKLFLLIQPEICKSSKEIAEWLLDYRLKRDKKLRRKDIDRCWLYIFSQSIGTLLWASAVSHGKAYDRKRNKIGREGWYLMNEELQDITTFIINIGADVTNKILADANDLNIDVAVSEQTKEIIKKYVHHK